MDNLEAIYAKYNKKPEASPAAVRDQQPISERKNEQKRPAAAPAAAAGSSPDDNYDRSNNSVVQELPVPDYILPSQAKKRLEALLSRFREGAFMELENGLLFDCVQGILYGCLDSLRPLSAAEIIEGKYVEAWPQIGDIQFAAASLEACKKTFCDPNNPRREWLNSKESFMISDAREEDGNIDIVDLVRAEEDKINRETEGQSYYVIPAAPITEPGSEANGGVRFKELITFMLRHSLTCKGSDSDDAKLISFYREYLQSRQPAGAFLSDDGTALSGTALDFLYAKLQEQGFGYFGDVIKETPDIESWIDVYEKALLKGDYFRSGRSHLDMSTFKSILTSAKNGLWELLEYSRRRSSEKSLEKLPVLWFARPPHKDIDEGALCGIDFGTSSTSVAYYDGKQEQLLRIGQETDIDNLFSALAYENPTVIRVMNIKDYFERAYKQRKGRPFTKYDDLKVSYDALKDLEKESEISNGNVLNSIFHNLKSWTKDPEKRIIIDKHEALMELSTYSRIQDGYFDPIEIYAYNLGLSINRIDKFICLNYYLSYPVNFGGDICERICESFKRGLKKSLPPAVIDDIEAGKRKFNVELKASEPCAFAISAIKKKDLEPAEGEEVLYAVFDFGGGTTDFDFGICRGLNFGNEGYYMELESLGQGCQPGLGGEHIVDYIVYRFVVRNSELFAKLGIQIAEGVLAGSDRDTLWKMHEMRIVSNPRSAATPYYAHTNKDCLAAALECIWKDSNNDKLEREALIEKGTITRPLYLKSNEGRDVRSLTSAGNADVVDITDESGDGPAPGSRALIDKRFVEETRNEIEKLIKDAADNFFAQIKSVFFKRGKLRSSAPVNIFLAGNSCKSEIVRKLFSSESIKRYQQGMFADVVGANCPETSDVDVEGRSEAAELFKIHQFFDTPDVGATTCNCKTGVALGLLQMDPARGIVRIKEAEAKERDADGTTDALKENAAPKGNFIYDLGDADIKGRFSLKVSRHDLSRGQWRFFRNLSAKNPRFQFAYTTQTAGDIAYSTVGCSVPLSDFGGLPKVGIYVQMCGTDEIRYAAGVAKEADGSNVGELKLNDGAQQYTVKFG